jgi:transcriptional regulator with XRE-family HTH domain
MTTESHKKEKPQLTGRRYKGVNELVRRDSIRAEVRDEFFALKKATRLVERLATARQRAGITQKQMAERLGVTQSAISKLEAGRDSDLTVRHIIHYAKATGERIGVWFGKPLNHVESVKHHALAIREDLSALAKLAHRDQELETAIQAFFGEAFFNMLTILAECQVKMPNAEEIEVSVVITESAKPPQTTKLSSEKEEENSFATRLEKAAGPIRVPVPQALVTK